MCEITRRRRALKMTDDFNIARMTKKLNGERASERGKEKDREAQYCVTAE